MFDRHHYFRLAMSVRLLEALRVIRLYQNIRGARQSLPNAVPCPKLLCREMHPRRGAVYECNMKPLKYKQQDQQ